MKFQSGFELRLAGNPFFLWPRHAKPLGHNNTGYCNGALSWQLCIELLGLGLRSIVFFGREQQALGLPDPVESTICDSIYHLISCSER